MTIPSQKVHLPCAAEKLIVHRHPMLLIDNLVMREDDKAAATATLNSNNLFWCQENGILPEYYIEIMAQTMAAANGFDALSLNCPPNDGFIVGLDAFTFHGDRKQKIDDLYIFIEKTMEFGSVKIMKGEVTVDSTLISSVELKVWEQNSNEE